MKRENDGEQEVRALLQKAFPAVDTELRRDLWPAMLRRMEERPAPAVPWYDWALAAGVMALVVFFPEIALLFAYHL